MKEEQKMPFVKCFRTPNDFYCFDANKSELIDIPEEVYRYLLRQAEGNAAGEPPAAYTDFRSRGYFSEESRVQHVRHPMTDYIETLLERKLGKLTLQVTQNCNFRCKYCIYSENSSEQQRSHSQKNMSWKTAKKAVDFLRAHAIDSEDVNISFYGGEPLLKMGLIRQVVAYAEECFAGKRLSFNMTTNGTLLNEEIVRYLEEHKIKLMISLDGPKKINDKNRVFRGGGGTFDTVMERIELVRRVAPEYAKSMQISMVMDPQNDFDCINEIYLNEKELSELFVAPAIVDREYDDAQAAYGEEFVWKRQYQAFLAILAHCGRIDKNRVSPIAAVSEKSAIENRFDAAEYAPLYETDAPGGPCMPGQLRLFCNVDENLFPCERVSETSEATRIGNLTDGFDVDKVKRFLNVGQVTEEDCRNCWSFRFCSLCGKKADSGNAEFDAARKKKHCGDVRNAAYEKIKRYLLFQEMAVYYGAQLEETGNAAKDARGE